MCNFIAILLVSLVSFTAITLCVASQRVFIVVYFVIDSVLKIWIRSRTSLIGGWIDPRFGLDPLTKVMPSLPMLEVEPRSSSLRSPVTLLRYPVSPQWNTELIF
jgi:hypothetical protein